MKAPYTRLLSVAAILGYSTVWAADVPLYQSLTDNKPDVGVITTAYLGDRMLEQRHGQYEDCIVPDFSASKSMNLGVAKFIIKAGEPACRARPDAKHYTPNYPNWIAGSDVVKKFDIDFADAPGGMLKLCMMSMGAKSGCTEPKLTSNFRRGPRFLYSPNTLQQTIEYAGRSGSVLKFVYSEYSDGYARQSFNREFQVDLGDGKIAAYKGAVIEIEKATNADITYKVVRNFQESGS